MCEYRDNFMKDIDDLTAERNKYRGALKTANATNQRLRAKAERFLKLFGPEPWTAYGSKDGNELACCSGHECGCGGMTFRERSEYQFAEMPALEYVRLEAREVGAWESAVEE